MQQTTDPAAIPAPSGTHWLLREWPFLLLLLLAAIGIGYAGNAPSKAAPYWQLLAPVYGVICIASGWRNASETMGRTALIWTQALHWLAILVAMRAILLPGISSIESRDSIGLQLLALLALGTVLAGIHARSWRISVVGIFLGLGVPAAAWIENSSLTIAFAAMVVLVLAIGVWWARRRWVV